MKTLRRVGLIINSFILAMIGCALTDSPAHAQVRDSSGYQLTVSQSTATSVYEGATPTYTATLVHPATGLTTPGNYWILFVDTQAFSDSFNDINPTTTTLSVWNVALTPGVHTIKSTFHIPGTSTVITSNVITQTVQRATPNLSCGPTGVNSLNFGTGATVYVVMNLGANSTYNVTFTSGSVTVTESNLTVNAADEVPATLPTIPGTYDMRCTYNGSALFNPVQYDYGFITVSTQHSIGDVQLSSSLARLAPNQPITLHITLQSPPGLPPPSGTISLSIPGSYNSTAIPLNSSGDVTVTVKLPTLIDASNSLSVYYYGDSNYGVKSVNFAPPFASLSGQTSTPLPGTSGTPAKNPVVINGTSTQTPVATATSGTGAASPTQVATATAIPGTLAVASKRQSPESITQHAQRTGDDPPWLLLMLVFLVLGGTAGALLYYWHGQHILRFTSATTTTSDDTGHALTFPDDGII